jgi:galactokinase
MATDPRPGTPTADRFTAAFGHAPEGVWAAPGRGNLIGEFTDYNGGSVLPFALDRTTRAAASRRDDGAVVISSSTAAARGDGLVTASLDTLAPEVDHGWADYVLGVVWAMRAAGHHVGGVELHIDSDVPIGAGLSSSAALECAVALAVDGLYETGCSRQELATIAQRAENDYVGVPCGIMDQAASLRCEPGHVLLLDTASLQTRQVPCDPGPAGLAMLLVDTRVSHELGDSAYAERRRTCEEAAARLGVGALCELGVGDLDTALARLPDDVSRRRVRHVVTEDARVAATVTLLDGGDLRGVGPLLTTTHRSLRDDFEVSCPELDTAVDAALEAGAYGARMIGGGFGGCVLIMLDAGQTAALEAAVLAAFTRAGHSEPVFYDAVPAAGALRLR